MCVVTPGWSYNLCTTHACGYGSRLALRLAGRRELLAERPIRSTVPAHGELIDRNDHLEQNQEHDNYFEPQRAPRVDDVGQHLRALGDHGELAVQRFRALLEFVLVLQPGIQSLKMRLVPTHIGFLRYFDGDLTPGAAPGAHCRYASGSSGGRHPSGRCAPALARTAP